MNSTTGSYSYTTWELFLPTVTGSCNRLDLGNVGISFLTMVRLTWCGHHTHPELTLLSVVGNIETPSPTMQYTSCAIQFHSRTVQYVQTMIHSYRCTHHYLQRRKCLRHRSHHGFPCPSALDPHVSNGCFRVLWVKPHLYHIARGPIFLFLK